MKLLIISENIPYPLSNGGKVAQFTIIDYLRSKCDLSLLFLVRNQNEYIAIENLKKEWENVSVDSIPLFDEQKQKPRIIFKNINDFIIKKLKDVKYKFRNIQKKNKIDSKTKIISSEEIISYLISFALPRKKSVIDSFTKKINNVKPDLVQFEFVETLDLALCVPEFVKLVFVHHEVRHRRLEMEVNTFNSNYKDYGYYAYRYSLLLESNFLNKFHGIVTFNEEDKISLEKILIKSNIIVSPFAVMDKEFKEIKKENLHIKKLVYIGFENHSPNRDAIDWYAKNLSRIVYEKFGFILHITGNWSEQYRNIYATNPALHFTGYIEDISNYCMNSIMIVPLRIGSGIRTKILYAMAWGIPVLASHTASEGIFENDKILVSANTIEEYIEGIHNLSTDRTMCNSLVVNAQEILRKYYSQHIAGQKRLDFYRSLLESNN